jgi:hypothetical protein
MRAKEFTFEAKIGTEPKRPARPGSRPERGHEPQKRYVTDRKTGKQYDPDEEFDKKMNSPEVIAQMKRMSQREDVAEGPINMMELAKKAKALLERGMTEQQVISQLVKEGTPSRLSAQAVQMAQMLESEQFCEDCGGSLAEAGKASRELCKSSKPDADLGASNLASCKSQGLRARDGEKSHKLGKGPKSRVTVGGHRIKGRKYGGPLPDWS